MQGAWKWTFNGANMGKMDPTINYKQLINSYKIDIGEIMTLPTEKLQGMMGNAYSHIRNMTGQVTNVELGPNYVLVNDENSNKYKGVTLGPYINGWGIDDDYKNDPLFVHEFGHTIQSKLLGSLYMSKVGIPSGFSGYLDYYTTSSHNHDLTWFEINSNQFGQLFFNPVYDESKGEYPDSDKTSYKDLDWSWFPLFNPIFY